MVASAGTPIARWSMDPTGNNFPATLDSAVAMGQGTQTGGAAVGAAADHLITFNGLGDQYVAVNQTAGSSLYANGNSGGAWSYNAGSLVGVDGALFMPQDQYGNEFSFTNSFTVEMTFRTDGDQSGAGTMQMMLQGEGFFRYGLIMNEAGAGSMRFAMNDGVGSIPLADLTGRNYADGQWHALTATYDAGAGANGTLTLGIASEDGSYTETTTLIDGAFAGLPTGNDGNMFIGRNTFGQGADPRTFVGLIDEIQISDGLLDSGQRLVVPTPGAGVVMAFGLLGASRRRRG